VLLADVDDALGYGHLMHYTTPCPNAG
jgi:hypothetical protein